MTRDLATPIALAALYLAFATVCLALWLSGGRGPLTRAKLRLGGLILGLAGLGTALGTSCSCYRMAPLPDSGDSHADTGGDTSGDSGEDTDTDTGRRESLSTTGTCPELDEVLAAPAGEHEILYEGHFSLGVDHLQDGVGFAGVFTDTESWQAFLEAAGIDHMGLPVVDFDSRAVQLAWVFDGTTCGTPDPEIRQVVLQDGTRHLDVTVIDHLYDDCDMTIEAGAIHSVPVGPASVCARLHRR